MDYFLDRDKLMFAEFEFPNLDVVSEFKPIGLEVTDADRYKNFNCVIYGRYDDDEICTP